MSSHPASDFWNEGLKLVSFCPVCESRYNPMEAHALGQQGQTHLLHVQCHKCSNSILALILVNQVSASSVGLLTDLSYEDVLQVRLNKVLSIDDVLQVHTLFQDAQWQEALGRASQQQVHTVLRRREKNRQKIGKHDHP